MFMNNSKDKYYYLQTVTKSIDISNKYGIIKLKKLVF